MLSGGDTAAGTAEAGRVFSPAGGVFGRNMTLGGDVYRGEAGAA